MKWTTLDDLRDQVQRLWDRGVLLRSRVVCDETFPIQLRLKVPSSKELSDHFDDVRVWIAALKNNEGVYRIEWREFNHRLLGVNRVPDAIWVDSLEHAVAMIGKRTALRQFDRILAETQEHQPQLIKWIEKRPLQALDLVAEWGRCLDVVEWMNAHPRPGIYIRQMDVKGVDTKFIEKHRGVLSELFDVVMPQKAVDSSAVGVGGFAQRYGFLEKPKRIRFRMLDTTCRVLGEKADSDMTLTQEGFAELNPSVQSVFITENEINFLSFPEVERAMIIFGAGYGFENLRNITWLQDKQIWYWGDIDTHGFAILNQLRGVLPHVESMLMDEPTLLAFRELWSIEDKPTGATLQHLTSAEQLVYSKLCDNVYGVGVRLEQERIGFDWVRVAVFERIGK